MTCRTCGRKVQYISNGKCFGCRGRVLTAKQRERQRKLKLRRRIEAAEQYEPTEAELDAIIAEQRKNLPGWWSG